MSARGCLVRWLLTGSFGCRVSDMVTVCRPVCSSMWVSERSRVCECVCVCVPLCMCVCVRERGFLHPLSRLQFVVLTDSLLVVLQHNEAAGQASQIACLPVRQPALFTGLVWSVSLLLVPACPLLALVNGMMATAAKPYRPTFTACSPVSRPNLPWQLAIPFSAISPPRSALAPSSGLPTISYYSRTLYTDRLSRAVVQPYPSGPHPTSFVGVPHSSPSRKVSYPTISLYPTFPLCPGELSLNSCTRRPPTDYTTAACLLAMEAGGYWQGPRTTAHPSSSPFYASDKGRGKRERKKARDGEKIEGGGMREHHT